MEIIFILVPVSLVIVILAVGAFVWSVRHDQFEDLEKEAWRIIVEDEPDNAPTTNNNHRQKGTS